MGWDSHYCEHDISADSCPYCKDDSIRQLEDEVDDLKYKLQLLQNELKANQELLAEKRPEILEFPDCMETDARRWRALLSSQMIETQGSAHLGSPVYQHLGLTLWSTYNFKGVEHMEARANESTEAARKTLTMYADGILSGQMTPECHWTDCIYCRWNHDSSLCVCTKRQVIWSIFGEQTNRTYAQVPQSRCENCTEKRGPKK